MKRHVLLRKLVQFDSRLDARIFVPENPEVRGQKSEVRKKAVEFAKKWDPALGAYVDVPDEDVPVQSNARRLGGGLAAAGVLGYGGYRGARALHGSVMGSGGYGAVAKDAAAKITPIAQDALGAVKTQGASALASIVEKLKKLKGVAAPALARVGLDRKMPQLVEFEARLDAVIFRSEPDGRQKKNFEPDKPSASQAFRNVAGGIGILGTGAGVGLVGYHAGKATQAVRRSTNAVARKVGASLQELRKAKIEPTLEELRKAGQNSRFATAHLATAGRIWVGAGQGAKELINPGELLSKTAAAFREGKKHGGLPEQVGPRLGRLTRRWVKGFEARHALA